MVSNTLRKFMQLIRMGIEVESLWDWLYVVLKSLTDAKVIMHGRLIVLLSKL